MGEYYNRNGCNNKVVSWKIENFASNKTYNQTKYLFMEIINTFKQSIAKKQQDNIITSNSLWRCLVGFFVSLGSLCFATDEDGSAVENFCNTLFKCVIKHRYLVWNNLHQVTLIFKRLEKQIL